MTENIPESTQVDYVAKAFLTKCAGKAVFICGKLSNDYFAVRQHILNQLVDCNQQKPSRRNQFSLSICHQYALTLSEAKPMSFKQFVEAAYEYNEYLKRKRDAERAREDMELRQKLIAEGKIGKPIEYSIDMLKNM